MAHLQRLVTRTDTRGRFTYGGPSGATAALWIEAPKLSPRYIASSRPFEPGARWPPVTLQPGGSLEIDLLPDTARLDKAHMRLGLRPLDSELPAGAYRLLLRRIPEDGHLLWSALEPGPYEVWLKAVPGSKPTAPRRLALAEVAVGERTRLAVELPAPREDSGDLRLRVIAPRDEGLDLALLRRTEDGVEWLDTEQSATPEERILTVPGGCHVGATYVVSSVGAIALPVTVERPEQCLDSPPLVLVAAAQVAGTLVPPRGYPLPGVGELSVAGCAGDGRELETSSGQPVSYPFAVDRDSGTWRAPIPAGCSELSLRAGQFLPVHWTSLNLAAEAPRDLGDIQLKAGSAVLARVVDRTGGPARAAVAYLVSTGALARAFADLLAGREPAAVAATDRPDAEGWLELRGVPSGPHVLLIDAPASTPATSPELELVAGREHVAEDLWLPEPASLAVDLPGEHDEQFDPGTRFEVVAFQQLACGWTPAASYALEPDPAGVAELAGLAPGTWRFELFAQPPELPPVQVDRSEIELSPGGFALWQVEVESTSYAGYLRTGDGQPLQAGLRFEPSEPTEAGGASGAKAHARSDAEGSFAVRLPSSGRYTVRVADESGLLAVIPEVVFDDPEEPVEIELPGGSIEGTVVAMDGRPAAGARVTARQVTGAGATSEDGERPLWISRTATAGIEGRFALSGLTPGSWTLQASWDELSSRPQTLELASSATGLQLVLEETKAFTGRVIFQGRAVAGALGRVHPLGPGVTVGDPTTTFRTDATGAFELALSETGAPEINVMIETPGLPITTFRADPKRRSTFELPPRGGGLLIEPAGSDWGDVQPIRLVLVAPDGSYFNPSGAASVSLDLDRESGRPRLMIPHLATGPWSLVHVDSPQEIQAILLGAGTALPPIAEITVTPDTVTRSILPSD